MASFERPFWRHTVVDFIGKGKGKERHIHCPGCKNNTGCWLVRKGRNGAGRGKGADHGAGAGHGTCADIAASSSSADGAKGEEREAEAKSAATAADSELLLWEAFDYFNQLD